RRAGESVGRELAHGGARPTTWLGRVAQSRRGRRVRAPGRPRRKTAQRGRAGDGRGAADAGCARGAGRADRARPARRQRSLRRHPRARALGLLGHAPRRSRGARLGERDAVAVLRRRRQAARQRSQRKSRELPRGPFRLPRPDRPRARRARAGQQSVDRAAGHDPVIAPPRSPARDMPTHRPLLIALASTLLAAACGDTSKPNQVAADATAARSEPDAEPAEAVAALERSLELEAQGQLDAAAEAARAAIAAGGRRSAKLQAAKLAILAERYDEAEPLLTEL